MTFRDRSTDVTPRRRTVRAALGVLLAVAVGAVPVLPGVSLSPADAFTKWQSGIYTGKCGTSAIKAFASWRKASVERTSGYIASGDTTWKSITTLGGLNHCLSKAGVPVTLSVPMLPAKTASLTTGAKGSYNKYWTSFGKKAVAEGYSHATLRIGWEMNGNWFPWSAQKDPKHWAQYWRQIVKTLRKVRGQHFTYEWAPGLGSNGHTKVDASYPGDAYVSYIGSTVYDQWYGQPTKTPAQIWTYLTTQKYGLSWLASFAKKHHKKVAIAEWGLASSSSFAGGGGGDDPYFISHFYSWMKKSNVAYDVYFNRRHTNAGKPPNEHRILIGTHTTNPTFTKAAAAYRKFFGGG